MFDRAYCINLAHRTDRWQHFLEEQKFLNIPVERFEAIDGKSCGVKPGPPPVPGWSEVSVGNVGLLLSQRTIIKQCMTDKLNNVLIMEDDVEFDKTADIKTLLDNAPTNWQMLYFGGHHREKLIPVNDYWGRCSFTLAAHALAFKKHIFPKLLDITSGLGAPGDLYYAMLQRYYYAYAPLKSVAWQIDGYSDIEGKNVEYDFLK